MKAMAAVSGKGGAAGMIGFLSGKSPAGGLNAMSGSDSSGTAFSAKGLAKGTGELTGPSSLSGNVKGLLPFKAPPAKKPPMPPCGGSTSSGGQGFQPPAKRIKGGSAGIDLGAGQDHTTYPGGQSLATFSTNQHSERSAEEPQTGQFAAQVATTKFAAPSFGALPKSAPHTTSAPEFVKQAAKASLLVPKRLAGVPPPAFDAPGGLEHSKAAPAFKMPAHGQLRSSQCKAWPQITAASSDRQPQEGQRFDEEWQHNPPFLNDQIEVLKKEEDELLRQVAEARKREEEENRRREDELRKENEELKRQEMELKCLQEEQRKREEDQRNEEMEATAKLLHVELGELVDIAESQGNKAMEIAERIYDESNRKSMIDSDIIAVADEFENLRVSTLAALKSCSTFMGGKHRLLVGITETTKRAASEFIARIGKTERGLTVANSKVKAARAAAQQRRDQEARRQAAIKEAQRQEELFKQYDSDGDGKLSADDIIALCAEEYSFELSEERLQGIKRSEAYKNTDGVPFPKFSQLRTLIGIARGEVLAKERKAEAERRKQLAAEQCIVVKKNAATVNECMAGIEAEVSKAEQKAGPLALVRTRTSFPATLDSAIHDVDVAIEAARDFLAAAQEQLQCLGGDKDIALEAEAVKKAALYTQQINVRLRAFEARLARAAALAKTARERIELHQRKEALLREANAALVAGGAAELF